MVNVIFYAAKDLLALPRKLAAFPMRIKQLMVVLILDILDCNKFGFG